LPPHSIRITADANVRPHFNRRFLSQNAEQYALRQYGARAAEVPFRRDCRRRFGRARSAPDQPPQLHPARLSHPHRHRTLEDLQKRTKTFYPLGGSLEHRHKKHKKHKTHKAHASSVTLGPLVANEIVDSDGQALQQSGSRETGRLLVVDFMVRLPRMMVAGTP
jgi:hypothetical protein